MKVKPPAAGFSLATIMVFAILMQAAMVSGVPTRTVQQEDETEKVQQQETTANTSADSDQTESSNSALSAVDLQGVVSTIVYVFVGLFLFVISYRLFEWVTPFSIGKELIEDENQALGTLMGGVAIGISIIVAAAIV